MCLPSADDPREGGPGSDPREGGPGSARPRVRSACQEDILGVLFLPHKWAHDLGQCLPLMEPHFLIPKWTRRSQEPEAQGITRPASCWGQGRGAGAVGEERQARTGIRILLRDAPGLKVGGWNRMLPLPQLQESETCASRKGRCGREGGASSRNVSSNGQLRMGRSGEVVPWEQHRLPWPFVPSWFQQLGGQGKLPPGEEGRAVLPIRSNTLQPSSSGSASRGGAPEVFL